MIRVTLTILTFVFTNPVSAQPPQHAAHETQNHDNHDHDNHDHKAHHADQHHGNDNHAASPSKDNDTKTQDTRAQDTITLASNEKIAVALKAGGTPVVANVLGVVCDFCAKAMDKTFGKREEVAAVYVDLDSKTLNIVLKAGQNIDDETITKLVKKSGYKVDKIYRGAQIVTQGNE